MRIVELKRIDKIIFSTQDIADFLSIDKKSANVLASRYLKKGLLTRLKKNYYILSEQFKFLKETELFGIANFIQTPSYISLSTALSFYNITTQQQRNFIESIARKRTKNVKIRNVEFNYKIVREDMYNGFKLENNFFIAEPEKAMADIIYMCSMQRYNIDFSAIDFDKIKKTAVKKFLSKTNNRTKNYWESICRTFKV